MEGSLGPLLRHHTHGAVARRAPRLLLHIHPPRAAPSAAVIRRPRHNSNRAVVLMHRSL
jgi:hypothetical protein